MADPVDTIVEVREELMVSPTGGNPTLRIAHFLKPSATFTQEPTVEPQKPSFKASISGWGYREKDWPAWLDQMASLHQSTWKKAGIYEAILSSTYQIQRDNSLVLGIVERWCSRTKTFVFPWGEATVTLEDVMVLEGYSVLGDSVLTPVESKELKKIEEKLKKARSEVLKTRAKKACQSVWMKKFMNSGSEVEHEAFLACWLSRYVLPTAQKTINEHVFSIAIHLARGKQIALAPAVLAGIYRDLSSLKKKIVAPNMLKFGEDDEDDVLEFTLLYPFRLVQVWAWERFLKLRPKPNVLHYGDPRTARWDKVNGLNVGNVRLALDAAGESFQWRPYAMTVSGWDFPKFYAEEEMWVIVGTGLDEEYLQSFARCLRDSELVGLGCIEQYLPHRVAMQFGMDQDLPGYVDRVNKTAGIAWKDYSKPISDVKLYIPSRLFDADVTARYLEWRQSVFCQRESKSSKGKTKANEAFVPPKSSKVKMGTNNASVPPGFPPKCNWIEVEDSDEEDKLTVGEMWRSYGIKKMVGNGNTMAGDGNPLSVEKIMGSESVVRESIGAMEDVNESNKGSPVYNMESLSGDEGANSSSCAFEIPGLELEARIRKLERVVAELKAARFA